MTMPWRAFGALMLLASSLVHCQSYPSKPIRIVVPFVLGVVLALPAGCSKPQQKAAEPPKQAEPSQEQVAQKRKQADDLSAQFTALLGRYPGQADVANLIIVSLGLDDGLGAHKRFLKVS